MTVKRYRGNRIDVTFDSDRCLHAAECIAGAPEVFDVRKRPWIYPDGDEAEHVAEVVRRCPSGALHYQLNDGPDEEAEHPTNVERLPDGEIRLRGDLTINTDDGTVSDTRATMCGCGRSGRQPFCDLSGACGGHD
ncbi:(4Fe-4S)-binding protein [Haloglycomyces albus]|uniref:(4Fe-4S)-binding protein n=1 Tax=Haloglycomyces albus TaxID=526067 RepID=UPI00046D1DED|nr:(4Fe-4S)-binding protein [Haloglycomyces albus]